jgi:hypothetical protein
MPNLMGKASDNLLAHARWLAAQKQYQFAVVFAHAACELHTEGELLSLINARSDKVLGALVLPDERDVKSLATGRVYRVYAALTDDYPAGQTELKRAPAEWWKQWSDSRQDRHEVAHRGKVMTPDQANIALDVAGKYMQHITEKVDAALKKLQEEETRRPRRTPHPRKQPEIRRHRKSLIL